MKIPTVAIVGRPNVGKSTLFNVIAGRRIAITEPTRGVTRDRVTAVIKNLDGARIELTDTGGMGVDTDVLAKHVEEQITFAIEKADAIVFLVDAKDGIVPQDKEIARRLRKIGKPILLVVGKVETKADESSAEEFVRLGMGEPFIISSVHRKNTTDLKDKIFELAGAEVIPGEELEMRIAVVGQRNVGKSTFINVLANEKRVIVSELPGTTRDSIDVRFEKSGKSYVIVDTAGVRKRGKMDSAIEFFSRVRAEESIRTADVALLMIDATRKIGQVDKKLAFYVDAHYKPCVIVVNKWDLAKDHTPEEYGDYIGKQLPQLSYAPISFVSAKQDKGVQRTIDLARVLWKQARTRVATPLLNDTIETLKTKPQVDGRMAQRPKIYYATQVAEAPPTLIMFVNDPQFFSPSYRRFIGNFLRLNLPFKEIPLVVRYKKATQREQYEKDK